MAKPGTRSKIRAAAPPVVQVPAHHRPRSLTAAGAQIDLTDQAEQSKVKRRRQDWQAEAWGYYEEIGEVRQVHAFYENSIGRVRYYPAYRPEPGAQPVPLDPADPTLPPELVGTAVEAIAAYERLAGDTGSLGHLLGGFGVLLPLIGEGYVLGYEDPELGERWVAASPEELILEPNKPVRRKGDPSDREGVELPNAIAARIWRPNRRFAMLADSPMRPLLGVCEELLLLTRTIRAVALSRIAGNGLLLVPDSLSFVNTSGTDGGDGQEVDDPFIADLIRHMTTPISDPDSAAAIVPLILRGDAESLKAIARVDLTRSTDPVLAEQRKELLQRYANGVDLPAEVVLGMSEISHWGAWQVDETTFRSHIEPLVQMLCDALTVAVFRPLLGPDALANIPILWYDPAPLVADPDVFDRAVTMHTSKVVNDSFLRRAGGATDEDAPSETEPNSAPDPNADSDIPSDGPPGERTMQDPPDEESMAASAFQRGFTRGIDAEVATIHGQASAIVAAASRVPVARLGARLARIDRDLFTATRTLADLAVSRAIERAGSRLRSRLQADTALAAALTDTPNSRLASAVGAPRVKAWSLTAADLVDVDLSDQREAFVRKGRRAYEEALKAGARASSREVGEDEVWDEPTQDRADRYLLLGWQSLSDSIHRQSAAQLFAPLEAPKAGQVGEFDASIRVLPSEIREALAVAGGANTAAPRADGNARPSEGIAGGDMVMDIFQSSLALIPAARIWIHGDPITDFPPHAALDGVVFVGWDDEQLANHEDWPDTEFYFCGDHLACQCQWENIYEEVT